MTCDVCKRAIDEGEPHEAFVTMGPQVIKRYHGNCLTLARKAENLEADNTILERRNTTLLQRLAEAQARRQTPDMDVAEALAQVAERWRQDVAGWQTRATDAEARVTEANVRAENERRHRLQTESEWRTCDVQRKQQTAAAEALHRMFTEVSNRLRVEQAKAKPDHEALLIVVGERDKAEAALKVVRDQLEDARAVAENAEELLSQENTKRIRAEGELAQVRDMAKIATDNNAIAQQQMGDMRRQVIEMRYRRKGRRK